MELREILTQYKEVTEKIIISLDNEDNGEEFIEKREELINNIKNNSFDRDEFKRIYNELNLKEIEEKTYKALENEKAKVKEEMIMIKKKKAASQGYGNAIGKINLFSTKV